MAGCVLTQDFNLDCRGSVGGIKIVYLIETSNIFSITDASGVVISITKTAGSIFRKYYLTKQTSNLTNNLITNESNGAVYASETLELIINKLEANKRNEIMLLSRNNITAVVGDNNGKYWLLGREQGLVLTQGVAGSGTSLGDRNGYTLPFAGNERELAYEVPLSVVDTLPVPGSLFLSWSWFNSNPYFDITTEEFLFTAPAIDQAVEYDLDFGISTVQKYLAIREMETQPEKETWENTEFNYGVFEDQVFREPIVISPYRYYVSRIPVVIDSTNPTFTFHV